MNYDRGVVQLQEHSSAETRRRSWLVRRVSGLQSLHSADESGRSSRLSGRAKALLTIFAMILCLASLSAQPKQKVPPFLQNQPAPQVVELEGKTFLVPDFSIAPALAGTGGAEFITNTPLGFLATRRTKTGLQIDLRRFRDVFRIDEFYRSTPNPLAVTEGLGRTPNGPVFDFTKSAPHLAFFCRLEINEDKGFIIPAKFRLGGHTYWQDNLSRRD
ncbi:hypothetical protein [Neolewinella persica]|uniref:hypothetical protein n=1 Tax=Neolewinella persica TaxID=70998 RepID=UPI000477EBD8|nr:hypothetical protein [Neolewinella persica]